MQFTMLSKLRAEEAPNAHCISDSNISLTNVEFHKAILRAAGAMDRQGIREGDVVALMLPNQVEFVVAMFAAWYLGAAITPINPMLTQKEANHQLQDSKAKLLISLTGEKIIDEVISIPVAMLNQGTEFKEAPVVSSNALALLIYTSGTTGLPKGVMLDHSNIIAMTEMGREGLQISEKDHCLLILPLFHVNGIVVSILVPLASGGRVTIRQRFDLENFFSDIEQLRPTYFSAVPTIYAMLYALPKEVVPDVSSLRYGVCGAAPASADLLINFEKRYGFPIVEAYGLSEGTCGSTLNPVNGIRKAGTVGLPLPGQKIAIADFNGRHLSVGEIGEVLIQGKNVMRGYLNKPEETAKTIVNGWLHTGDIGRIDDEGYLSIVGRLKEMIIRGGENIYPKEIEDTLLELPEVLEAAVIGAADEKWGEVVLAFVAFKPNSECSIDLINQYCKKHLTRYKQPEKVIILSALPKNAVGKIDKPKLRELYQLQGA
ncbi:AMP-binding protein [Acinetobacter baumannii]|uniref:class I adenylate-forming enzyme family protein n=1 Tax=Acinetobacter calcoaceticus/baumannii complex TaxID=909768 RepID=UPI00194F20D6|nr:AMP-binding protein [Acinetobacter pittii]MDV7464054.1 AMP-binding protein [Acinetobacter baumannii]QRQ12329.1 AMP-binding protein [Acinetobacter pittii]HAV5769571.1 AMP-dependent synthetase [Acinetobacter baumannii]